jgi:large subunit ribosomal protein L25
VAGERVQLQVSERERRGSADARRLRRAGLVPGVLYGKGKQSYAIYVPERELRRVLTGSGGLHAILDVVLEGKKATHPSILKDFQQDPVRGKLVHVDLQEVPLDEPIEATVVVQLVGEAQGAKEGGVLSQVNREVRVQALPMEVPEHLELDVSEMTIGDTLRVADLRPPAGATLLDDPETVLATVTMPTRVVEPEEMLEAAEAEGVEAPPAEEAAEGGSEAQPREQTGDASTVEG